MQKINQAIASRTFWTIVATFLINAVPQFESVVPVMYKPLVDAILGLMAVYFHLNPSQNYDAPTPDPKS